MTPQLILRQINESLRDPRGAARWLASLDIPRGQRWELLALAMLFGVFVTHFSASMTIDVDAQPRDPFEAMMRDLILLRPYVHATKLRSEQRES